MFNLQKNEKQLETVFPGVKLRQRDVRRDFFQNQRAQQDCLFRELENSSIHRGKTGVTGIDQYRRQIPADILESFGATR